jgi:hypothetical protein
MIAGRPRYTTGFLIEYVHANEVATCHDDDARDDIGSASAPAARCGTGPGTRRASLGTDDPAVAEDALLEWITRNVATDHANPRDVTLARIFLRYHEQHGQHTVGPDQQRISLAMILRTVPEGMTAGQFTLDAQHEMARALSSRGYAPGTIKRAFGAARQQ